MMEKRTLDRTHRSTPDRCTDGGAAPCSIRISDRQRSLESIYDGGRKENARTAFAVNAGRFCRRSAINLTPIQRSREASFVSRDEPNERWTPRSPFAYLCTHRRDPGRDPFVFVVRDSDSRSSTFDRTSAPRDDRRTQERRNRPHRRSYRAPRRPFESDLRFGVGICP